MDTICTTIVDMDRFPKSPVAAKWCEPPKARKVQHGSNARHGHESEIKRQTICSISDFVAISSFGFFNLRVFISDFSHLCLISYFAHLRLNGKPV